MREDWRWRKLQLIVILSMTSGFHDCQCFSTLTFASLHPLNELGESDKAPGRAPGRSLYGTIPIRTGNVASQRKNERWKDVTINRLYRKLENI